MTIAGVDRGPTQPESGAGSHDVPYATGAIGSIHPIGWVAAGVLVVAVLFHTVFDTKYLIGNFEWWHWAGLGLVFVLSLRPIVLHKIRLGIEVIPDITGTIAWILAWFIFLVQFFNVLTRYGNDLVEQDILFGQTTSLAWQSFALLFLLGVNYGLKAGVNPRIDFWWADFTIKTKGWIDFVLHVFLLLPFVIMSIRILRPYAEVSLGRSRDGTWESGWRVWNTWEESPDADQLAVGPIKALIMVSFILFGIQLLAEIIKAGFMMMGRNDYGDVPQADAPLRVE